jgi:hypothetical protein
MSKGIVSVDEQRSATDGQFCVIPKIETTLQTAVFQADHDKFFMQSSATQLRFRRLSIAGGKKD